MASFKAGDYICYRKGGPPHQVQSIFNDGRILVTTTSGILKLLTRPEDFVRIRPPTVKRSRQG
jgi:hypothetical protein